MGCKYNDMKLTDYLKREDITVTEFGLKIGRSAATVSRIARGVNQPDWDTMGAIAAATKGEVEPNDFSEVAA